MSFFLLQTLCSMGHKPVIITSRKFATDHLPNQFHYERPERISESITMLEKLNAAGSINLVEPSAHHNESRRMEALEIIKSTHTSSYVEVFSCLQRN